MKSKGPSPQPGKVPGSLNLAMGEGRLRVELELQPVGKDWLLLITGGQAHVGALGVAEPGGRSRALVLGSHREGPLAKECAGIITTAVQASCAVVAGIHQDQATAAEIQALVHNARSGTLLLARVLTDRPEPAPHNP